MLKSGAASVYGTRGQDMCLAELEARGEDQGEKPTQADARSLYWSAIWPSITSRDNWRLSFLAAVRAFPGKPSSVALARGGKRLLRGRNRLLTQSDTLSFRVWTKEPGASRRFCPWCFLLIALLVRPDASDRCPTPPATTRIWLPIPTASTTAANRSGGKSRSRIPCSSVQLKSRCQSRCTALGRCPRW